MSRLTVNLKIIYFKNWIDELKIQNFEVIRVLNETEDSLVLERAQSCTQEMEKVLEMCCRRKLELQNLLEQVIFLFLIKDEQQSIFSVLNLESKEHHDRSLVDGR